MSIFYVDFFYVYGKKIKEMIKSSTILIPILLSFLFFLSVGTESTPIYTIGANSDLGGYIFYVTNDGRNGLVAATQDQSASSSWYNAQNDISNPANHNIDGKNFRDWRLPTKHELNEMYLRKDAIGGFASRFYWSSTENRGPNTAWPQSFVNGDQSISSKSNANSVRAVRAF
jgi:hypothetical protein